MGLGSLIRKVGKGIGSVSKFLPGPAGTVGRLIGSAAGLGKRRPPAVRSGGGGIGRFAAPDSVQDQFRSGGGIQVPRDLQRAAEGVLVGGGTAIAGLLGGPAGAAVFGTAFGAGKRALGPLFGSGGGGPAAPAISEPGFALDLMPVTFRQEARAPKGFKVHTVTPSTAPLLGLQPGEKVAVRLGSAAARVLGVKRSKKPVISVRDSEALRRAARAKKKLARVSKGAGLHVTMSRPRRK